MHDTPPASGSLVLYKVRPARVVAIGEKIEIELEGGQTKRVRPKDVRLLHPGPLNSLKELEPREGDVMEAWELLEGGDTDLRELSELIYSEYTPATAWATWQRVAEGLYFEGSPKSIRARKRDRVEREQAERAAKARAKAEWEGLIGRLREGRMAEADRPLLEEVRRLALGRADRSRILKALGHQETRENAHRLLVQVGYWPPRYNPYPERLGVPREAPDLPVPPLPAEAREDLTALPAFAIDDEGNQDPDDALSIDGDRLWVHVADVAALVAPDSELDQEARARGANLYLPEGMVNMLPEPVTPLLGLGLQETSPALSIGFTLGEDGSPADVTIRRTRIRVQRLSYEQAEGRLDEAPFKAMRALTEAFRAHRHARDAAAIELPEVSVRLVDGEVRIRTLPRFRSRDLVTDAMLMAGEAVARYCEAHAIAIPYAGQEPPERVQTPTDMAAMYAYRRQFKPSRLSVEPRPHFGLGLERYTRATSPLRRYSDLLVHQQLRAHLAGEPLLSAAQVAERVDLAEAGALAMRRAERLSNTHWKLIWLRAHPEWTGKAVVVEKGDKKLTALIPKLALDVRLRVPGDPPLNACLELRPREIDVPDLRAYFRARPCA